MKYTSKLLLLSVPMMVALPQMAHARRGIPIYIPTSGPMFYILVAVGVVVILFKIFSALSAGTANAAQFVASKTPRAASNAGSQEAPSSIDMARMDQIIAARARELQTAQISAQSYGRPAASFGKRGGR